MQHVPLLKIAPTPWYREPWPWLIMAGPAAVIVAGVYTTILAFSSTDGLVADDYYKQGLMINQTLGREERARALRIEADVRWDSRTGRMRLSLVAERAPQILVLRLIHPTRAGLDLRLEMRRAADGGYEGVAAIPAGVGRWNVLLETPEWRLAGDWTDPARAPLALRAARP